MGCWLGKAVGGTLGQSFEGSIYPLAATFYDPVPDGMVPNDDLDLQVVHACSIAAMPEPDVDRHVLAAGWKRHVEFPWNEYGVGQRNLAEGIAPPHSGSFDNWYTCGEGAAIRSELWACLAAGDPDLAAAYAYEDACFDHAGDGVHAAQFLAAMQAQAFVESDPHALIETGLRVIPTDTPLADIIRRTRDLAADPDLDWLAIRDRILDLVGNDDFTDVRPNTAFVILGLLRGTDFASRILLTNNCGLDTDSSTASVASLLGIIDPDAIPESWLSPIGRDLILNDAITNLDHPATLDDFTDLVLDLRTRLDGRRPSATSPEFDPADHTIPVERAFFNYRYGSGWIRDISGLPAVGAPEPDVPTEPAILPGTWVEMHRDDFADDLMLLRYTITIPEDGDVHIMLNSTEPTRIWLNGEYIFSAQGSANLFPSPHSVPVGQSWYGHLPAGEHRLTVVLRKPLERDRYRHDIAEWVLAIADAHTHQWIPNALRPQTTE